MWSLARHSRKMTRLLFLAQSLSSNPKPIISDTFYDYSLSRSFLHSPVFTLAFLHPIRSCAIRAFCSKPTSAVGVGLFPKMQNPEDISYLTQREAAEIDEILMGPLGFSVDPVNGIGWFECGYFYS